ncbi:glycosyl transferase [Lysinibacillus alkalisoli]|uniref:Glycosyl transferase n=1 Tax=Lysinibacillus alkalisoli TaxID=1911548 RepID=A0A917LDR4_9BACI|nr:glycosyltransferase family 2 protein [Lysinibacillus alkalisoli]GGG14791.1 glycosyl transferase [Lysinibacillus alkalisoli]
MHVSIIVPCYNEEQNIEAFYEETRTILNQLAMQCEIIFINDGSKDGTQRQLSRLHDKDDHCHYIQFSRNFGKEAAMLAGLSYATGAYSIIMDADLQHPPELIPKLIEKAEEGYDQVIAKRNRKGDNVSRTFFTNIYYKCINAMTDVHFENGIGDFRLLSRKAVNALLNLREYNRFSKGLFSWIGFEAATITYENVTRAEGDSKWSFRSLLNYGIDGIISFNNKPLRLAIYGGLLITLLDFIYIFVMFIQTMLHGIEVPGYFTTIAAVLFLGGVQLIAIGIIGEYIGRIYYEVKQRPPYLVAYSTKKKVDLK